MKRKHKSASQPFPRSHQIISLFPRDESSQIHRGKRSQSSEARNTVIKNTINRSVTPLCLAAVILSALLVISCGGENEPSNETADASGSLTIQLNVEYPVEAVTTGYRPSIAVYAADDYSDFTQRPESMPIAALIGEEGDNSVSGLIMDFAQSQPYIFEPGEYSLVMGVAEASGMPSHVDGTVWLPVSVSLNEAGVELEIGAEDERWRVE